ncbi:PAS domain-containing protein [Salinispira pacifica]|uniref:histidine kinase n=1 Tax=Salinispira pacifica TaxID=1307761 RepID=V5WN83_9SPIO|nr:PAS domain-containing protein [Salinispira pacifica]AHC16669.1 Signal transduction histidine kinase [Salinispira pacifica]
MIGEDAKTLLLVEDDPIIAIAEKKALKTYGYNVITAGSGEKAVNAVNSDPEISLILMDIDLGSGIDGTEATARILTYHEIPIVFLSSHSEREIVEKTEHITSYGYVVKNSSITVLDASIKMAFKLFNAFVKEREKEAALRKNEEMMRNSESFAHICSYSTNLVETDIDKSAWVCSPNFYNVFGIDETYPHTIAGWSAFLHPDFRESTFAYHERVIRERSSFDLEYNIIRINDGAERWVHGTGKLEFDAQGNPIRMHGAIQDITERKEVEEALMRTKRLLSESEQIGKVGGWELNIDTGEQTWTEETYRIHEVELDFNLSLEKSGSFYTEKSRPILENVLNRAIEYKEPFDEELEIITAKGNHRHVHAIGKTDLENRRILGFIQDITYRKSVEKEIKRQLSEKETLLKEVHHRMKNNITSIEGLLLMQADNIMNPEAKNSLKIAISRVQGVRVLYEKLLVDQQYEQVSIKSYIEELLSSILSVFPEYQSLCIEKDIADVNLNSNKAVFIGIIINELITNIFKHAFHGETDKHIHITFAHADEKTILIIRDDGIGFSRRYFRRRCPVSA